MQKFKYSTWNYQDMFSKKKGWYLMIFTDMIQYNKIAIFIYIYIY